ncbi:MAG: transporter, partial [Alphaproteobacteria bacterium]
ESKGWGDTKLSSLVRLYESSNHNLHLNLGLSLPTGAIDKSGQVLAPNGMRPVLRLPYAMQLGTGTYDFLPGLTYTGQRGDWNWGAQYNGELRLEDDNDEGYSHGDKHVLNIWGGYQWNPILGTALRFSASTQDDIDGIDTQIVAPVQTANPDNYGGTAFDMGLGVNVQPNENHRLGFEVNIPVYQDLNGVQMERDWAFTAGWQVGF